MTIGEKLKYILMITNMSAKELSQKSGVSLNTIYGITCRNRKNITPEIDKKLSLALDLPCLLSSLDLDDISVGTYDRTSQLDRLLSYYEVLNQLGKEKALDYMELLSTHPEYKTDKTDDSK
jgi:transcriptional regulator with XRE-family HTH domain